MAELINTSLFNDTNLQAYYKLEDTSDSKNAHTLTNNNSVTFTAAKYNNGANLGTSNTNKSLSRTADDYSIAGNGDFSIAFWMQALTAPASGTSYPFFIIGSQTTTDRYLLCWYENSAGTLRIRLDNSGNSVSFNIDLGTLLHHICVVRQGTTGTKLYLDNVDRSTTVAQGTTASGSSRLIIGNDGGSTFASALIDDMGIFNRQLNATEVALLASSGTTQEEFAGTDAAVMAQRNFYKRSNFSFMKKARAGFKGAIDYVKNKSGIYVPKGGILRPAYAI